MYKVCYKIVYPKISSIGESIPETVVETVIQSETYSITSFYHIIVSLSANTWNFWVNSFIAYFVHTMESAPCLCLNISYVIHL